MTGRVHNKYHHTAPSDAKYIGRGSRHGNSFVIGRDGDRDQVIHLHKMDIARRPVYLGWLDELHGKDLICFCKPKACHGDILASLAAMSLEERLAWARDYLEKHGG